MTHHAHAAGLQVDATAQPARADGLISVVVPVYEEAESIHPCLRGLWEALRNLPHEILICYDHAEDSTLAAIKAMPDRPPTVRLVPNNIAPGALGAMRAGMAAAGGDVVVTVMADLSDPPQAIPAMAQQVRAGAAVVAGSRYMKGGRQIGGPLLKRTLSRAAGLSLHWLAGLGTHDATNNFRAYSREFLRKVTVESTGGFELAIELTVKAHRMGLKVDEVPSTWQDRQAGQSRFRLARWLGGYMRWYIAAMTPRASLLAVFAVAMLLANLAFVAWGPHQFGTGLDQSWDVLLHIHLANGTQFASDFMFTYGPWGALDGRLYHPDTYSRVLLIQFLVSVPVALALTYIVTRGTANRWGAAVWLVGVSMVAPSAGLAMIVCLLALHMLDERPPRWLMIMLAAAVGLSALVKFTYFVMGAGVIGVIATGDIIRRRAPWTLGAFTVGLLGAWIAAGQQPLGIFRWILNSMEVARGYTGAMAMATAGETRLPFIVAAGLMILAVAASALRGRKWLLALNLAGLAGLLMVMFKQVFVRQFHAAVMLAPLVALVLMPLIFSRRRNWLAKALIIIAALVSLQPAGSDPAAGIRHTVKTRLAVMESAAAGIFQAATGSRDLEASFHAHRDEIADEMPFPAFTGTVDIYPHNQGYLLAHDWLYSPRPMPQSYSAYTARLARVNARHLAGPAAPDNIFFNVVPTDYKYPSLEDGLSWPELLTRYEPAGRAGPMLHLVRSDPARQHRLVPLQTLQARLGEEVNIDAHAGPVWAEVHLQPTARNRLALVIAKAPLPLIVVNDRAAFRLIPDLARAGFLLSPLVRSAGDFRRLWRSPRGGLHISSMRVEADHRHYLDDYTLRLYTLEFQPLADRFAARFAAGEPLLTIDATADPHAIVPLHGVSVSAGPDGLILTAHDPDPHLELPWLDVPAGASLLLKLEMAAPTMTEVEVFYGTVEIPGYTPAQAVSQSIDQGANIVYMEVPGPGLTGRLRLDPGHEAGEYILHSLEIRSAPAR